MVSRKGNLRPDMSEGAGADVFAHYASSRRGHEKPLDVLVDLDRSLALWGEVATFGARGWTPGDEFFEDCIRI